MASGNDELVRLILEVEGAEGLNSLKEQYGYIKAALDQLKDAYQRGDVTQEQFLKNGQRLGSELSKLGGLVNSVERELKQQEAVDYELADAYELVGERAEDAGHAVQRFQSWQEQANHQFVVSIGVLNDESSAMGRLGVQSDAAAAKLRRVGETASNSGNRSAAAARGVLELSRGVEDFTTGGPIGVLNNIPGMFSSIGAAVGLSGTAVAGLTAGVSLLATGVYILWRNWDGIMEVMGHKKIETEAEEIERLEKATKRTADETARLHTLKKEEAKRKKEESDLDRLKEAKSEREQQIGAGVTKAIGESGGGDKVLDALTRAGIAQQIKDGFLNKHDSIAIEKEAKGLRQAYAKQLLAASRGSKADRDDLQALALKDPTNAATGFGLQLKWHSPEWLDEQKDKEKAKKRKEDQMAFEAKAFEATKKDRKERQTIADKEAETLDKKEKAQAERKAKQTMAKSQAENRRNKQLRERDAKAKAKRQAQDRANPQEAALRDQTFHLSSEIQRQTGMGEAQATKAAQQAISLSMQKGVDLQSATLAVVQQMAQQQMAFQQQYARMQNQLSTIQGQMRRQLPSGRGTYNPYQ